MKEINDDQNYKIVTEVVLVPSGKLRVGEILQGKDLKALLVYNLAPFKLTERFYTETNEKR
tara:strand:+ start:82 stop:264 length:183 start_codon:yes stop_codon:yes gene_type:complete